MSRKTKKFSFKAELWFYKGTSGWCFVTVPKDPSEKIREFYGDAEEGWGRLKTVATIGNTSWETSVWFDSKHGAYLLPVKALVRKKEKLVIGETIAVSLAFH